MTTNVLRGIIRRYTPSKVKRAIRLLTAKWRASPDFIVVGTQKGGTSSFYSHIIQHPQILRTSAVDYEVNYFNAAYHKGPSRYRSHFPLALPYKKRKWITGEKSPSYMSNPHVFDRIHQFNPTTKLIFLLRNPVERAISHYGFMKKFDIETLSIEDALEQEDERIGDQYDSLTYRYYSYQKRGIYVEQIERCFKKFQKNQALILKSEDLFAKPHETLKKVFLFLDVDPNYIPPDLSPRNVGSYNKSEFRSAYKKLSVFYAPHNKRLNELLNEDFGW